MASRLPTSLVHLVHPSHPPHPLHSIFKSSRAFSTLLRPYPLRPYPRLPRNLQPHNAPRRLKHWIPKPPQRPTPSNNSPASSPENASSSASASSSNGKTRKQLEPHYQLTFTCVPCGGRSSHTISKQGYHSGSVLITCPSCRNRHVISDHLGIFGDRKITVEDLMRERGRLVKRGTLGEDGDVEFWQDETENLNEDVAASQRRKGQESTTHSTNGTPEVKPTPPLAAGGARPSENKGNIPHANSLPSSRREFSTLLARQSQSSQGQDDKRQDAWNALTKAARGPKPDKGRNSKQTGREEEQDPWIIPDEKPQTDPLDDKPWAEVKAVEEDVKEDVKDKPPQPVGFRKIGVGVQKHSVYEAASLKAASHYKWAVEGNYETLTYRPNILYSTENVPVFTKYKIRPPKRKVYEEIKEKAMAYHAWNFDKRNKNPVQRPNEVYAAARSEGKRSILQRISKDEALTQAAERIKHLKSLNPEIRKRTDMWFRPVLTSQTPGGEAQLPLLTQRMQIPRTRVREVWMSPTDETAPANRRPVPTRLNSKNFYDSFEKSQGANFEGRGFPGRLPATTPPPKLPQRTQALAERLVQAATNPERPMADELQTGLVLTNNFAGVRWVPLQSITRRARTLVPPWERRKIFGPFGPGQRKSLGKRNKFSKYGVRNVDVWGDVGLSSDLRKLIDWGTNIKPLGIPKSVQQ